MPEALWNSPQLYAVFGPRGQRLCAVDSNCPASAPLGQIGVVMLLRAA